MCYKKRIFPKMQHEYFRIPIFIFFRSKVYIKSNGGEETIHRINHRSCRFSFAPCEESFQKEKTSAKGT